MFIHHFSPNPRENFPLSYSRCRTLETLWDNTESIRHVAVSSNDDSKPPELIFNRLQVSDEESIDMQRRSFGRYIAREAVLNEEYWMAAWLRAEAHWEASTYKRHAETFKMKYADQEFKTLKKRCSGQDGNMLQSFCLVAVKKEVKNMKRTVLNSIVGTMDLSIRQHWQGETYPGDGVTMGATYSFSLSKSGKEAVTCLASNEPFDSHTSMLTFKTLLWQIVIGVVELPKRVRHGTHIASSSKQPFDLHKYAYISNVVVAKYARRRGIASNMLGLATHIATSIGMKKLFVHVTTDNKPAQEVYKKVGFEFATTDASSNGELLMWMEL
ncbi:acyl-CoA N-acyltransferase [Tanacetum coccineum]|uniref:Acyl-CoA N-acyltransferase n=1 Tax=Tanacetum coccineum TaxID=301880 RepID=A0ABQ5DQ36_9ASTR